MRLPVALLLALAVSGLAHAAADDRPERIARLGYVEGDVIFQAEDKVATRSLPERPLRKGDRIGTEPAAAAELALGTALVRLDQKSALTILELDEATVSVELLVGSVSVSLDELREQEVFEILTPNAFIKLAEAGEYRADVYQDEESALTVHKGAATVKTESGEVTVTAGQRVRLTGRTAVAKLEPIPPADAFDDWVVDREVMLAEAEPARYTPYEGDRNAELDRYGEWHDDPRYGRVWVPGYGYADWSPYGSGYWRRSHFGWSWYDPAPWWYHTYYGGRWTYLDDRRRWCWVPTRARPRDVPHDTRPYRHPRGWPRGFPRDRETPESAPRTADRSPPPVPSDAGGDSGRGGRIGRGTPPAPRPSTPVASPPAPRESGPTVQPSRPERPRTESAPARNQNKEFGTRREP